MMRTQRGQGGWTLIEMMIALALVIAGIGGTLILAASAKSDTRSGVLLSRVLSVADAVTESLEFDGVAPAYRADAAVLSGRSNELKRYLSKDGKSFVFGTVNVEVEGDVLKINGAGRGECVALAHGFLESRAGQAAVWINGESSPITTVAMISKACNAKASASLNVDLFGA